MGIVSSLVIPLVLQEMKQRQQNSTIAQEHQNALELEETRSANAIAEAQAKGVQDRYTAREQSSLTTGRFSNEYWPRFAQGVATGVAGGIASGAAKGYFTQKFRNDNHDKDGKNNNNKRPPTGPSAAGMQREFTDAQIQKAKDWLSQKQAIPQFAREVQPRSANANKQKAQRVSYSESMSEFRKRWNLDSNLEPNSRGRNSRLSTPIIPNITAPAVTYLTII